MKEIGAISLSIPACVLVTICIVFGTSSDTTQAVISCTGISESLSPCILHLKSRAPSRSTPPRKCCAGVKAIKAMALQTGEHRAVCECMKYTAASIHGFKYDLAVKLPARCEAELPFIFRPITDSTKV